jgi:hypothetical protein
MRKLSAGELLSVWEEAESQPPTARALLLLAAAFPDQSEGLAQLSVGRRDAKLLLLRQQLFGSRLRALTECPTCEEAIEAELEDRDLINEPLPEQPETLSVAQDGCEVRFRLPNSLDLLAVSATLPPEHARQRIIELCLVEARCRGELIPPSALTPELSNEIVQRMAEADPHGNIELKLHCPVCARVWTEVLDMVSFVWVEIQTLVTRLLREVHELAWAYGWGEEEILALSPWRRQAYLDLIRQ